MIVNIRLGLCSSYSLLYGVRRPGELIDKVKTLGTDVVCIADRDNLYGLPAYHVGKNFPLEGKTSPHKGKSFPSEEKTSPLEGKISPAKEKISPHEGETFPMEEKTSPHKEKDFPAEEDWRFLMKDV
jgi:hypothetical protein